MLPFSSATYSARRSALSTAVGRGLIVLPGNTQSPINYAGNVYPFQQDGSFLYYAGLDTAGLALALDAESGEATLYGHDPTMDDVIWEGPLTPLAERAAAAGISRVQPREALDDALAAARKGGREVLLLPPYRADIERYLSRVLGSDAKEFVSRDLIRAVVDQRSVKTEEEVREIEVALELASAMHASARANAVAGATELEVAATVRAAALAQGGHESFQPIVSVRGEVLHNHATSRELAHGDLLLVDAGATAPGSHYASDITRTFPVGGRFSDRQRAVYQTVLDAQLAAIEAIKPGVPFRDAHRVACLRLAEGLIDLGVMRGSAEGAVDAGAHALFFPHGLGHMMGLDVHDMEGLGEDFVGYDDEVKRSEQFGTEYLRMGRRVEPGFVLTVEPGLYFIGPLMDQWQAERRFEQFIDYDAAQQFRDFGGVRIEDDVVVTEDGCRILGEAIPKTIEEVESDLQAQ